MKMTANDINFKIKYPQPDTILIEPIVPFWGAIPGGLQVGKMILISGHVNHGTSKFNIDFSRGSYRDVADVALHFNPRFDQRLVVRNSYVNGSWQKEEREPTLLPFSTGRDFDVLFLIEPDKFKIAVNGRHFVDFVHRLPFNTVDKLNIEGSVRIKKIEYTWQSNQVSPYQPQPQVCPPGPTFPNPQVCPPGPTYPNPQVCPPGPTYPNPQVCPPGPFIPSSTRSSLQPVQNPALPFRYPIYDGIQVGMMIYISGRPSASPDRLEINLQCSSGPYPPPDIALHFNPRFGPRRVIRNSYINQNWGREEEGSYEFPFTPGAYFDLVIRIESDKYMIAVNGKHFTEFRHRIMPLSRVNTLAIEGDAVISCVRFQ